MSGTGKLLEANETIVLIPAYETNGVPQLIGDTLVPFSAPTVAVVEKWRSNLSTTTLAAGGNVSCAIKDDVKLEQTASDTDKDRSICSIGNAETPTFYNFDAELNGFMDADPTALGLFNMFRDLTFAPDVRYVIAQRIGYRQNVAAAVGQIWDFYYAWTDFPVLSYKDGANMGIGEKFIPKNIVNLRYTLAA